MAKRAEAKYVIRAVDKTRGTLRSIERNFKRTGRQMSQLGSAATMGLTAPIVAFGALSLRAAGNYEQGMNRVQAITDATGPQFVQPQEQAKEMGRTTQYSAGQSADAMGFLAQAGFDANQVLGAMPSTLQLAASAQIDLARAADITSNILTGYEMKTSDLAHANDVLVKTFTSTNVDLEMLGESMKYVAPIAKGMGFEFEETAAAVGLLGNAGIQGSMAGTALRKTMSSLAKPSAEAAAVMKRLGLEVYDSSGKMKPLVEIIEQLETSGAETKDMLALVGERAGPGLSALVSQGSDALRDLTEELRNSGGAAAKVSAVQMKGLNGAMRQLRSAFEGLQIALAESGLMAWVTNFVKRIAGWFTQFTNASKATHQLALKIAGLVAAIGPALFITGKLIAVIGLLANPIGLTIAVIAGLILAWRKWGDQVPSIVENVIGWIGDAFTGLKNWVEDSVAPIFDPIVNAWKAAFGAIADFFSPVINWIQEAFHNLRKWVHNNIRDIIDDSQFLLRGLAALPGGVGAAASAALGALNKFGDGLAGALETLTDPEELKAALAGTFQTVVDAIEAAALSVEGWAGDRARDVQGFVVDVLGGVKDAWRQVEEFLMGLGSVPVEKQFENYKKSFHSLGSVLSSVAGQVRKNVGEMWASAAYVPGGLGIPLAVGQFEALANAAKKAGGEFDVLGSDAEETAKTIRDAAASAGEGLTDSIVNAVRESQSALEALGDFAAEVFDAIARAAIAREVVAPLLRFFKLTDTPTPVEAKALGGPILGGKPYLVGEDGPELFVPGVGGKIIPNNKTEDYLHSLMDSLGVVGRTIGGMVKAGGEYLVGEPASNPFSLPAGGPVGQLAVAGAAGATDATSVNVSFHITANDSRGFEELLARRRPMIVGMIQDAFNKQGKRGPLG